MEYEIVRRLARGGMGVVDLAHRPDGSEVALKRLGIHGSAEEMQLARARFQRELETLRTLRHDAIVPLIDLYDDDGDVVLVMPYLEGGSLSDVVRASGPLGSDRVQAIADRLLPALAAAHRAGIVHRDIKPANILFDAEGRAHLADFGVASTTDATHGLTGTGVVLGTTGFLAPEQARGEAATAASDIASLGATLHFAATGRSPYEGGEPAAVLLRTARGRSTVDRDIDPDLRRTLLSMLDPKSDRRPSAAALAGGPTDTDPIPHLGRRTRRTALVVGALLAATLVAVGIGTAMRGGDDGSTVAVAPDPTSTEPPCVPLPYRPCGGQDAPNTDGEQCIDDHADYDGRTANGCEAAPDDLDGSALVDRIEATIVPEDDVDRYPVRIDDEGDLGCNNTFRLQIRAPAGMALRVELRDDRDELVGETTSADGVEAEIAVRDPGCFRDDAGGYEAVVSAIGSDRSPEPYVLTRSGSF